MITAMKEVMLKRMTRGSTSDKWMMVMVMLVKHSDNIDRSYQVPSFSAASQQAELERDQKRWREGRDHPGLAHISLFEQFVLSSLLSLLSSANKTLKGSSTSVCLNNSS